MTQPTQQTSASFPSGGRAGSCSRGRFSSGEPDTRGKRLRRLRKARGWTQADVANLVHCSVSFISILERDDNNPSVILLFRLAELYTVSATFIETGREH